MDITPVSYTHLIYRKLYAYIVCECFQNFTNFVISLLRNTIPNRIRIIVQLVVVAALVTIVSEILKAFA